ncbi:MAG: hypothetical protein WCJ02_11355 [bacterium]
MNASKLLMHGFETQIIITMCAIGSYLISIDWANNGYRLDDTKLFDLLLINGVILIAFGLGFIFCKTRYSSRKDDYSVSEWIVLSALCYAVGFASVPVYNVCEKIYKTLDGLWRPVIESLF